MATTYAETPRAQRETSFGELIGRVWPLFVFSLPGVVAFAIGLAVGYNYATFQIAHREQILEGAAALTIGLVLSGMLSFYAGLILYAILSLGQEMRGRRDW